MSVQLREPCTRSLRHLFYKPFLPKKKPFLQGSLPCRTWSTVRSYSTNAVKHTLTEEKTLVAIEKQTVKTKPTMKRKVTRMWTEYLATMASSKHKLDLQQYDTLIAALLDKALTSKKPGFWARIVQAFEDATSLGIHPSQNMYLAAIKAYGRCRDLAKTRALFTEYSTRFKLKASAHETYLTAVLSCGDLNLAHRIFRDINIAPYMSKTQTAMCLADLVTVCIRRHNVILAFKQVDSFHTVHWDPDALQRITLSLLTGLKQPTTSLTPMFVESFVQQFIATPPDKLYTPSHLYTMFRLFCSSIIPATTTCNLILEYTLKDQHFGRVKSILSMMQQLNVAPDKDTVAILTRGFGVESIEGNVYTYFLHAAKDIKSIDVCKSGTEEKRLEELHDSNCTDLDMYAAVLESWNTNGHWHRCIIEYDRLMTVLPHVETNRRSVKAMLTARFAETVDSIQRAKILKQVKINLTPSTVMHLLLDMIRLENKQGQPLIPGDSIFSALQVMESTLQIQLSGRDISWLITGLGNRGDIENGYRIYNWIRESTKTERCSDTNIYRALMASATKNNDIRRLERAWVDMQYRNRYNTDESMEKEPHTLTTYNILLNGYASRLPRPDITRSKRLFQRMVRNGIPPDIVTYNILIKAFVNANNMEAANQIYRKMVNSGISPDTFTTNTILNGWIIKKDWSHVENFVQELKSSPENHCSNLDIVTFNLIVQSFLQLDSKSMNYAHLLKNQNRWSHIKELEQTDREKITVPSKTIWNIFASTTGYDQAHLFTQKEPNKDAFYKLFSKSEPDQVTCKLFMKAFVKNGDLKSAHKVYRWMQYRQNLEKNVNSS